MRSGKQTGNHHKSSLKRIFSRVRTTSSKDEQPRKAPAKFPSRNTSSTAARNSSSRQTRDWQPIQGKPERKSLREQRLSRTSNSSYRSTSPAGKKSSLRASFKKRKNERKNVRFSTPSKISPSLRSSAFSRSKKTPVPSKRVYWYRRILALGVALMLLAVLVFAGYAIVKGVSVILHRHQSSSSQSMVVGESSKSGGKSANSAGSDQADGEGQSGKKADSGKAEKEDKPAIPQCGEGDIALSLASDQLVPLGSPVNFTIGVQYRNNDNCLMDAGPGSLVLTITSGSEQIWQSGTCSPSKKSILLASGDDYKTTLTWPGARNGVCAEEMTKWTKVNRGTYHAKLAYKGHEAVTSNEITFAIQ